MHAKQTYTSRCRLGWCEQSRLEYDPNERIRQRWRITKKIKQKSKWLKYYSKEKHEKQKKKLDKNSPLSNKREERYFDGISLMSSCERQVNWKIKIFW